MLLSKFKSSFLNFFLPRELLQILEIYAMDICETKN